MCIIVFMYLFGYIIHEMLCCCVVACMLRACRYIDEVLCTRGCERRLSHLSGSRDSVHFLRIDAEWSLDDAMLVQVANREHHTAAIEACVDGREALKLLDELE